MLPSISCGVVKHLLLHFGRINDLSNGCGHVQTKWSHAWVKIVHFLSFLVATISPNISSRIDSLIITKQTYKLKTTKFSRINDLSNGLNGRILRSRLFIYSFFGRNNLALYQ